MATFNQGINGPFQGKVGTVVGASWKGIPYMRSLPSKRTSPPTRGELANRKKWALSQQWLQPVQDFVRIGFKGYSAKSEGFVAAKSHLLKNAMVVEGENISIDPARVKLSWGDLPLPQNLQMTRQEGGLIRFTWDPTLYDPIADDGDQIMLLAYQVELKVVIENLYGRVRREGNDVLNLTGVPGTVHVYAAFQAHDRSRQSESRYMGAVEV